MSELAVLDVCEAEFCSKNECDAPAVSEVDDVIQGSEPGASRFSVLIPTDSYDDMAKLTTDTTYAGPILPHGTIEQLKDDTESDPPNSNSERTVANVSNSCLRNERLKPPEPIFARIDTPTSLSEDDLERRQSSAVPAYNSRPDHDSQQIMVEIFINIFSCCCCCFLL